MTVHDLPDELLLECAISGNCAIVPEWADVPLRWYGVERYLEAVRVALANGARPPTVPTARQWRLFSVVVRLHARGLVETARRGK